MSYHGVGAASLGATWQGKCRLIGTQIVCDDAGRAPPGPGGSSSGGCPTGYLRLENGHCCPITKASRGSCCGPDQMPTFGRECPPGWWASTDPQCCDASGQMFDDPGLWLDLPGPISWSTTKTITAQQWPASTAGCIDAATAFSVANCLSAPDACDPASSLKALQLLQADTPLCADEPVPDLPTCLDEHTVSTLAYCDSGAWSTTHGRDSSTCYLLRRNPLYYLALKQVPFCESGEEPEAKGDSRRRAMIIGGVALAALVGVGLFVATRRKH